MTWLTVAACVVLLAWLVPLTEALVYGRRSPPLDRIEPSPDGPWPFVSVIVPACNEQARVGEAMRTLLELDYPALEIIAVDDRSTDRTGAILDALAAGSDRLRVLHLADLPEGWLGKNHALHTGAAQARGEYFLFTDADVFLERSVLRRAMTLVQKRRLDHLTLGVEVIAHDWLERSLLSFFTFLFSVRFRPWRAADPASAAYVGIGAFNLVRAETYRRAGGHAALALEVIDDVMLGRLIKRAGGRQDCPRSGGLVRVRWAEGVGGLVRGMEKNAFAGFGFRPWLAVGAMLAALGIAWWPWLGLLAGPWAARVACVAALACMGLAARLLAVDPQVRASHALGFPVAAALIAWTILRSMVATYRQGGIVWRGTFYKLEDLRRARR